MSGVIRKSGRVEGRVQGVGFRFFTQRVGNSLGVTGWVRNAMDGSVEFEVQGSAEQVNQFVMQVGQGPRTGWVDRVNANNTTPIEGEAGFSIRY